MNLLHDKRKILAVAVADSAFNEGLYFRVGSAGVSGIEVSEEAGQMLMVPWFVVYREGKTEVRVNAAFVESVEYECDANRAGS